MTQSKLLADGSVRGFLNGSHFNRCKKLHPVTAISFKILHFKIFLQKYNEKTLNENLQLNEIVQILEQENNDPQKKDFALSKLESVLDQYDTYTQETLNGGHGYTAKFILSYVWFIELYQLFERAIRTSDLDLYIFAASKMCSLFFALNHQNYARWLSKNLDDLINIENTHPGLSAEFENGALSIRRTTKNFCRSPVDLTLEQTINADAANKLTGITAFTNSLHTRQKWSETHTIRTAVISNLLEFLNLVELSETTESMYQSSIFNKQIAKFTDEVQNNINPFSDDINQSKLFNLSSGKAASRETVDFLLNVQDNGMKQMQEFIKQCQNSSARFDQPIKRNVIKNFSSEIFKSRNRSSNNRIDETRIERNILGQILCAALQDKISLSNILTYPLTTVPHSLSHFDGTMISNRHEGEITRILLSKSDINKFEKSSSSMDFHVDIIDGFNLLKGFRDTPIRYGRFALFTLQHICRTSAHEIHIIFDHYESPSPRDVEMKRHKDLYEDRSVNFKIQGSNQERSSSFAKCMSNKSFREELVKFFIQYWSTNEMVTETLGGKRVFVSFGKKCYLFSNSFEKGKILSSFENNHMEVETKMMFHMYKIRSKKIRIQTTNVDTILIYLLYHMQFLENDKDVWIETGDINKNTIQLIEVRQIYGKLTPVFVNALISWYLFTGCKYEPSFHGKGRKTCIKNLEKRPDIQAAFGNVGLVSNNQLKNEDIALLEEFTSQLYSTKCKDVNNARFEIFQNAYETKKKIDISKKGIIVDIIEKKMFLMISL